MDWCSRHLIVLVYLQVGETDTIYGIVLATHQLLGAQGTCKKNKKIRVIFRLIGTSAVATLQIPGVGVRNVSFPLLQWTEEGTLKGGIPL